MSARKSIVNQIKKDAFLLENGYIKELIWVYFNGASKEVIKLLVLHNIPYIPNMNCLNQSTLKQASQLNDGFTIIERD